MRIGLNARYLLTEYRTGVEVYLESLVRHLTLLAPQHEVVLFLGGASHVPERLHDLKATFVRSRWPTGNLVSKGAWEQAWLAREIRVAALDVFHGPYFSIPLRAAGPMVVTVYDLACCYYPESFTWRFKIHWRLLLPAVLRRATRIIALSENTKADLVNLMEVAPERIRVVYAGVDAFFHEALSPQEMQARLEALGVRRPYLLHVSGYARRKNVPVVLRALRILKERGRLEHELVLAGGGGWPERVGAEVSALGLEGVVRYVGHVSREDLRALYASADAMVYPSLYEGFGLPPLEAMACGTPVVAASTSSLPEVLGSAGILVDPQDTEAWAEAIEKILIDTSLRDRLVALGLERVSLFTWERTARQTLAVYQEAADEAGLTKG
ncbi:MAG: glycosyltransferase family 1 protein [bacterium]|nr:glycosyltransferase family 1 protein [bacterium]